MIPISVQFEQKVSPCSQCHTNHAECGSVDVAFISESVGRFTDVQVTSAD
jgi:hypothetical protein